MFRIPVASLMVFIKCRAAITCLLVGSLFFRRVSRSSIREPKLMKLPDTRYASDSSIPVVRLMSWCIYDSMSAKQLISIPTCAANSGNSSSATPYCSASSSTFVGIVFRPNDQAKRRWSRPAWARC